MSDFADEPTNPDARPPLHPDVIAQAERMAAAARHFEYAPEVIADFDELLARARGGSR